MFLTYESSLNDSLISFFHRESLSGCNAILVLKMDIK